MLLLRTLLSSVHPDMQLDDVKQLLGLPFRPYLSGAPAPPNDEERVAWGKHLGIYDAPPDPEVSSAFQLCIALRTAVSDRMTVKHARTRSWASCSAPEALPVRCKGGRLCMMAG